MTELPKEDCIPAHEREKLPEEQKFDRAVYGGISYAGQALTGMGLTYWLQNAGGAKLFERMADFLGENIIRKMSSLSKPSAAKMAQETLIVSTMVMVGNMFVLPVKWLENHKARIVEGWVRENDETAKKSGVAISPEDQEKREKMLADLKAAPKQSWSSLWAGRFFSLIGVYAILNGPIGQKINPIGEKIYSDTAKAGFKAAGLPNIAKTDVVDKGARIAFYDMFYSMISAGGLYVYSHFIHPKEKCPEPDAATAIPPTPAPEPEEASPSLTVSAPELVKNTMPVLHQPSVAKHDTFTDYITPAHSAPALGV